MNKAGQLLEILGFKKTADTNYDGTHYIVFKKVSKVDEDLVEIEIEFNISSFPDKGVYAVETVRGKYYDQPHIISCDELKAIMQFAKELGWLEW